MISPLLVAAEYVEWRQAEGWDLSDCVFETRVMCGWHSIAFDAEGASWDDVIEALASVWKQLDRILS